MTRNCRAHCSATESPKHKMFLHNVCTLVRGFFSLSQPTDYDLQTMEESGETSTILIVLNPAGIVGKFG